MLNDIYFCQYDTATLLLGDETNWDTLMACQPYTSSSKQWISFHIYAQGSCWHIFIAGFGKLTPHVSELGKQSQKQ